MSENPTTIQGEADRLAGMGWNDAGQLLKCEDGGGVFHRFKTIRTGSFAELVSFVMSMPDDQQANYAILKEGDRRFTIGEIRELSRHPDFPRPAR